MEESVKGLDSHSPHRGPGRTGLLTQGMDECHPRRRLGSVIRLGKKVYRVRIRQSRKNSPPLQRCTVLFLLKELPLRLSTKKYGRKLLKL